MDYKIELGEKELRLISQALDLYSRLGLFQFEKLDDHTDIQKFIWDKDLQQEFEWKITPLKALFGYPINGSRGIFNKEVSDTSKIMCDMHQTIRHELWKNQEDRLQFVTSAHPADICRIAKIDLPKFKVEKNDK